MEHCECNEPIPYWNDKTEEHLCQVCCLPLDKDKLLKDKLDTIGD